MTTKTNEINNIFKQAKQGSVAATIQVLNEKLADSGVRTRAIFSDGVLQLLCEAATLEQLEQPVLVERIRTILEGISPRNIRRVNINSRIVREQQLLWLDEINRDPEKQVLWSEEITLKRPNVFQQFAEDWSDRNSEPVSDLGKPVPPHLSLRQQREKRQFQRGLTGGIIASCCLLAGGWWLYTQYGTAKPEATTLGAIASPPAAPTSPNANLAAQPGKSGISPFVEAVRLAEQTSQASQTAQSSAEWLALAAQWQKASDLMGQVPTTDNRYKTAQDRVIAYQQNREIALVKAKQVQ
jgi:hypothetical protein